MKRNMYEHQQLALKNVYTGTQTEKIESFAIFFLPDQPVPTSIMKGELQEQSAKL